MRLRIDTFPATKPVDSDQNIDYYYFPVQQRVQKHEYKKLSNTRYIVIPL